MDKVQILNFLKQKKGFLKDKFAVEKIGLFGSYAKDKATKQSDIDIFVVYKDKKLDNMTGLLLYLEDVFGKKVDLFHYHNNMRKGLKYQIEQEIVYA